MPDMILFGVVLMFCIFVIGGIVLRWLYDAGKSHGISHASYHAQNNEDDLRRSHAAELKQLAIDFGTTLNVLRDQHDQELADLRQRCAEYVSERLRLDRSSGVEFPLTNIECGINKLPLRAEKQG